MTAQTAAYGAAVGALLLLATGTAHGEGSVSAAPPAKAAGPATLSERDRALAKLSKPPGFYARLFASLAMGKGLRFSNPYRLASVLGDDAASLSATATYLDGAATLGFGDPNSVFHGPSLHLGSSVQGVFQPYFTPSYVIGYRADLPVMLYGRLGSAIVLAPDVNAGGELAFSASYFFLAGLGVTSELVFDLFYGAATLDKAASAVPTLSAQLGIIVDYEFLP